MSTILVVLTAVTGAQTGVLAGLEAFRAVATTSIVRAVILFLAMTLGAWWHGVTGATVGLVLAEGLAVAINRRAIRDTCTRAGIGSAERADWQHARGVIAFALPSLLSSLATQPALWFGSVLLSTQPGGFAALGIYNAADRWRQLLLFLPATLSSNLLATLSNLHGESNRADYRRVFRINLVVMMLAVAGPAALLSLLGRLSMRAFGPDFATGSVTVTVLAVTAIFVVLNNALGQVLVSQGLVWWRFGLDVLLSAVLAICAFSLVPRWHEAGLALASLAAYAATALVMVAPVFGLLNERRQSRALDTPSE